MLEIENREMSWATFILFQIEKLGSKILDINNRSSIHPNSISYHYNKRSLYYIYLNERTTSKCITTTNILKYSMFQVKWIEINFIPPWTKNIVIIIILITKIVNYPDFDGSRMNQQIIWMFESCTNNSRLYAYFLCIIHI
jgi:hypothetical protein